MKILSIDVGTKNLAVCHIDRATNTLLQWSVEQIGSGSSNNNKNNLAHDLLTAVYQTMDKLVNQTPLLEYDVALIEKQPTNRQMIRVESMLAMFLQCHRQHSKARVIVYSPAHKLKNVAGADATKGKGKQKYSARKKLSVQAVCDWLAAHPQPGELGSELTSRFQAASKKDDYADSLMQALSFTEVEEEEEEGPNQTKGRATTTIIHARKPTDKQLAKRSFSLSNLKYLITEAVKTHQQQLLCAKIVDCVPDADASNEEQQEDTEKALLLLHYMHAMANNKLIDAALRRNKLTAEEALHLLGFLLKKQSPPPVVVPAAASK